MKNTNFVKTAKVAVKIAKNTGDTRAELDTLGDYTLWTPKTR